jgi:type IV secretory pathway TrbD component
MIEGVSWREVFIAVGLLCAIAGLVIRELHQDVRGLGFALFIVGAMMFIMGPVGSILGWW